MQFVQLFSCFEDGEIISKLHTCHTTNWKLLKFAFMKFEGFVMYTSADIHQTTENWC